MSYVKVMIHAVWGTKNRTPYLTKEILPALIAHIKENARSKQIYIDRLNGSTDHLHCLFALNTDTSLAKTLQLIKGESAYWLNKQQLITNKFEWADEYFAASVSESALDKVREYIEGQVEHHRKVTFAQEYDKFLKGYHFVHG